MFLFCLGEVGLGLGVEGGLVFFKCFVLDGEMKCIVPLLAFL